MIVFLGYELLFQPEVVRVYTSLLKESKNPSVLEAAAGAVQNLCAGRWTVSNSHSECFFVCRYDTAIAVQSVLDSFNIIGAVFYYLIKILI